MRCFHTPFRRARVLAIILLVATAAAAGAAAAAPDASKARQLATRAPAGELQAQTLLYLPLLQSPPIIQPADLEYAGYSLEEAALATAAFNVTLDPANQPQGLPFVILNDKTSRSFSVPGGTTFYVPLAFVDDSPPILGNFPGDASAAQAYFFGQDQLGGRGFSIVLDGVTYPLGANYLAGPVTTAPLPDGGGTHYMVIAAFLGPLRPGAHTITLRGIFDGALALSSFGAPFEVNITYTVSVT